MLGPNDLVLSGPPLGHVPLLDRLAPARAAGFAGISVTPADIWTLEAQGVTASDIKQRIADHGLAIIEMDCTPCWLPSQQTLRDEQNKMAGLLRTLTPERVIATAARVGARSLTAIEMFGIKPPLDEAATAFATVCKLAQEEGLRVHIEFLPFGGVPDIASAWAIVDAAGCINGGLTIDSWHLFRSGSTLTQLAAIPGERIFTVQLNDAPATPQADLMQETMNARLLPGEGSFDLIGLIRTLDRIGNRAAIGVEVFSKTLAEQPLATAAQALARTTQHILKQARVSHG